MAEPQPSKRPTKPPAYRWAGWLLAGLFFAHALLVSTHQGEFWPFSIYPMFSQGGHPWTRAVVREVPGSTPGQMRWQPVAMERQLDLGQLPGAPYALNESGFNQNDLAGFISNSDAWGPRRIATLRKALGEDAGERALLIMRADARLRSDTVEVSFVPFLLLTPDSAHVNPRLDNGRGRAVP